jgi:hypothetical protein
MSTASAQSTDLTAVASKRQATNAMIASLLGWSLDPFDPLFRCTRCLKKMARLFRFLALVPHLSYQGRSKPLQKSLIALKAQPTTAALGQPRGISISEHVLHRTQPMFGMAALRLSGRSH